MPIVDKQLGDKDKKFIYINRNRDTTKNVNASRAECQSYVLSDDEIVQLAHWACTIEQHYGHPRDIEWAKDGDTGDLFIVQARPETVQAHKDQTSLKTYTLQEKSDPLVRGLSIGDLIHQGCKRATVTRSSYVRQDFLST